MKYFIFLFLILFTQNIFAKGIIGKIISPSDKHGLSIIEDTLKPFVSDGCTDYSNGTAEKPDAWLDCCIEHDSKYWLGGTEEQKDAADEGLKQCVTSKGFSNRAQLMYTAVQLFGGPERNTDYRWGYGWTRLRYWKVPTDAELAPMKALYGDNLEGVEELVKTKKALVPEAKDHTYNIPLDYNFCEEQILLYLNDHLKVSAKINNVKIYNTSDNDHLTVWLDICGGKMIDFTFDGNTSSRSCQHDFLYSSEKYNKIESVMVPSECKTSFTTTAVFN